LWNNQIRGGFSKGASFIDSSFLVLVIPNQALDTNACYTNMKAGGDNFLKVEKK